MVILLDDAGFGTDQRDSVSLPHFIDAPGGLLEDQFATADVLAAD
jgi:hypothetical protein